MKLTRTAGLEISKLSESTLRFLVSGKNYRPQFVYFSDNSLSWANFYLFLPILLFFYSGEDLRAKRRFFCSILSRMWGVQAVRRGGGDFIPSVSCGCPRWGVSLLLKEHRRGSFSFVKWSVLWLSGASAGKDGNLAVVSIASRSGVSIGVHRQYSFLQPSEIQRM